MGDPPTLDEEKSTFQYVGDLQFRPRRRALLRRRSEPSSVASWLQSLRSSGTTRLWLAIPEATAVSVGGRSVDEHMLAGFSNAGRWSILTVGSKHPDLWHGEWSVGNRDDPRKRIWVVSYAATTAPELKVDRPDVAVAEDRLQRALSDAHDFAVEQDLSSWQDWFTRAMQPSLDIPYHPDMLPSGWPVDAHRCAARSASAWVFGGMGSWNDLAFSTPDVEERYRYVTRELYAAVLVGLVAATNAPL